MDVLISKKRHQVISRIAIVLILRDKGHLLFFVIAVRIFLKGWTREARLGCWLLAISCWLFFHQHLDEFCCTIAWHDILFADTKALAGYQRIDLHARRVFCQKRIEIAAQLVFHPLGGEVRIHQIAEVKHLREAPEATIATVVFADNILVVGKQCLSDVEVLLVVYLIPLLVTDGQCLHIVTVQHRDDA